MALPSNVRIVNVEQGSPEWFAARAGRVTSSEAKKLFMSGRSKGDESVVKRDYRIRLANEQILGRSLDDGDEWKGKWVERGKQLEHEARAAYEMKTGRQVFQVGFLAHMTQLVGSSIDGHTAAFGRALEFKCPKPAIHMEYWREEGKTLLHEYRYQVLTHAYVSGCDYVDIVSFCPDVPEALQLLVVPVPRPSLAELAEFGKAVDTFLEEVAREKREVEDMVARVEADAIRGAMHHG